MRSDIEKRIDNLLKERPGIYIGKKSLELLIDT